MPSTLSIIRNLFSGRQRTTAISIWSAAAAGGAALGPLVGGVLLEHFWWGSVFLINVPIVVVVVVGALLLVPESRDPRPGPFDLVSAVLSLAGVVPLVYAVKQVAGHGPSLGGAGGGRRGARAGRVRPAPAPARGPADRRHALRPAGVLRLDRVQPRVRVRVQRAAVLLLAVPAARPRLHPLQAGLRELPTTLASIAVIVVAGRPRPRSARGA